MLSEKLGKWISEFTPSDISREYIKWVEIVLTAAKTYCVRSKLHDRPPNPWWNEHVEKEVKLRRKLRRKLQTTRSLVWYDRYQEQVKRTKNAILIAKTKFWQKSLSQMSQNNSYKLVKNLTKNKNLPVKVTGSNGIAHYNPKQIGNAIGDFLQSQNGNIQMNKRPKLDPINSSPGINRVVLERLISKINEDKAAGSDEVCPFMVKRGGTAVVDSLKLFFDTVMSTGESPLKWYDCIVVPIPKKQGRELHVSEFRPISLNQVSAKLFEKCILEVLTPEVEKRKLIPDFQYGFRRYRSTIDNLIVLQQEIHTAFSEKEFIVAAFVDISKAYDNVDLTILANDILKMRLNESIDTWLLEYISHVRTFKVRFGNTISDTFTKAKGVPQGAPMSPLMFNLYMRGIPVPEGARLLQFADDIVIWAKHKEQTVAVDTLSGALKEIDGWLGSRYLSISPSKTKIVVFSRRRIDRSMTPTFKGKSMVFENSAKYLGVVFDTRLTWKDHVKYLRNKALLKVMRITHLNGWNKGLSQEIMIQIYKQVIRPMLEYASVVWGDAANNLKNKIDSMQHKFLSASLGVNRLARTIDVNQECGVWPLELRRWISLIKCWRRMIGSSTMKWLKSLPSSNRLLSTQRASFYERTLTLFDLLGIAQNDLLAIPDTRYLAIINRIWENVSTGEYNRWKRSGIYPCLNKKFKLSYSQPFVRRNESALWHQARLGVLPLNEYLFKINKVPSPNCDLCNKKEDLKHILTECPRFDNHCENFKEKLAWLTNNASLRRKKQIISVLVTGMKRKREN
jgi:hypothetical protein